MEIKSPCHVYKGIEIFSDHYKFFYFKNRKMFMDKDLQAIKRSIDGVPERICVGQIYKTTSKYGSWITMLAQVGPGYISAVIIQDLNKDSNDIGNRCNNEPVKALGGCNDISLEELNQIFSTEGFEYLPQYQVNVIGK